MNRRGFLTAAVAAPAVILTPGLLMPVRKLWTPANIPIMASDAYAEFESAYSAAYRHVTIGYKIIRENDRLRFEYFDSRDASARGETAGYAAVGRRCCH